MASAASVFVALRSVVSLAVAAFKALVASRTASAVEFSSANKAYKSDIALAVADSFETGFV